jgi:hypothetical protein
MFHSTRIAQAVTAAVAAVALSSLSLAAAASPARAAPGWIGAAEFKAVAGA